MMADPSVVDQLTRLKLKLLEKRLENEQENLEKMDLSLPAARNRPLDQLQSALRQRKGLLQELREQHLLEELSQPPAPDGGHCHDHRAALPQIYQIPFPASPVEPPRIIQQTMPAQPATIIQQLPHPSPVITQIPPAQPLAAPRSGSIKEDMVEMMLMQNAQMHQIMMQNMMLKALPPALLTQLGGAMAPLPQQAPFVSLQQGPAACCPPGSEGREAQGTCGAPPPPLPSHRGVPSAPQHRTALEQQLCPAPVAHILTVQDPLQVDQSLSKTNKILLFFLSLVFFLSTFPSFTFPQSTGFNPCPCYPVLFRFIYDFLKGSHGVFIRQHFFMLSAAWFCLI
ncbi:uncharacterized protein C21orf58 homolog isoform X1 [Molothrus aeneus]|uniref:uncharacterized protein C21orf58 homolog isoform X1 n=2 Tax=Molothrus aeneus TaxID=84833 RepID=UPI003458F920